ncbi:fatty acid--CoA ligase family protein [Knoellia locipacati]|uniref:ANL family adenylate-forming protein n=1 Tax=Knoellia locipacati TaxID=882824 RepID=UPI00384E7180
MRESAARAALRAMGVLRERDGRSWLELTTSGTSAAPRTVVRSLASWEDSFEHVSRLTGITGEDRVLVPAPPSGSMFAFAHAHAAHAGADVVALDRWSVAEAARALATCTAAHLSPQMLSSLLERDIGSLRTVVCAGAVLPEPVRRRADEAGLQVVDYYGAAELSFVSMRVGPRLKAFPEVEVDLRDGVVWARSPWLAEGYAAGQAGPMLRDADGFATVGDRGRWDAARGLVVEGRGDDAVTTGGVTVLSADVEAAVLSLPNVSAVAVVGLPHPDLGEVVEVVVTGSGELDLAALRARAGGLVDRAHLPRRWHQWDDLPLTAAGKVDRVAVRSRLLAMSRSRERS